MTKQELKNIPHVHDLLTFGKHKGESVYDVLMTNASYIIWCIKNVNGFVIDERLKNELLCQYERWQHKRGSRLYDELMKNYGCSATEAIDIIENDELPKLF